MKTKQVFQTVLYPKDVFGTQLWMNEESQHIFEAMIKRTPNSKIRVIAKDVEHAIRIINKVMTQNWGCAEEILKITELRYTAKGR